MLSPAATILKNVQKYSWVFVENFREGERIYSQFKIYRATMAISWHQRVTLFDGGTGNETSMSALQSRHAGIILHKPFVKCCATSSCSSVL